MFKHCMETMHNMAILIGYFIRAFFLQDKQVKPGLHISCKDRKHMAANTFLSFLCMIWSSHRCNDHGYSHFTRNICN